MSILKYINQNATRNRPLVPGLAGNLESAVAAVYGPGATVQVYSGGQPGRDEGGARIGSIRHDHGRAADVRVFGADGNQITGDGLAPLGQYWRANNFGGVGLEMHGGGIHLDDWTKPPPGGGMNWNYANQGGRYTDAMASAIAAGNKGVMPSLFSGEAQSPTTMTAGVSDAPQTTGDAPLMAYNAQPNPRRGFSAIDQQTIGSTMPSSLPASLPMAADPKSEDSSILGKFGLDMSNPRMMMALQLIMNGQKPPGQGFDGVPEIAAYGAKVQAANEEKRQAALQRNETYQFMLRNNPQIAQAMVGGLPTADAYNMWAKDYQTKNDPKAQAELQKLNLEIGNLQNPRSPDAIRVLQDRARMAGLKEGTPEFQQFILNNGAKPDTYRQLTPEEIQAHGLDPKKSYQVGADNKISAIGDAGVNITNNLGGNSSEFSKEADKNAAKRLDTYVQEGNNAGGLLSDMQQLTELGKQIDTGFGAQAVVAMGPYAQALGIDIKGLAPAQAYQSIIDRLAPSMRPPGSGSSSDFDGRQFLSGLPSLGRTAEGNEIINQTLQGIAQTKMDAAAIARRAQIGKITWQQADEEIAKLPNPYQRFKSWQKDNGKTTSTGSNQAPAADPDIDNLVDQYKTKRR